MHQKNTSEDGYNTYREDHGASSDYYTTRLTQQDGLMASKVKGLPEEAQVIFSIADIKQLEKIHRLVKEDPQDGTDKKQHSAALRKYINYIKLNTLTDYEDWLIKRANALCNNQTNSADELSDEQLKVVCESLGIDTKFDYRKSDDGNVDAEGNEVEKKKKNKIEQLRKDLDNKIGILNITVSNQLLQELYNICNQMTRIEKDMPKLRYKKAMMLYGPPGTGKTYTAMNMAEALICKIYSEEGQQIPTNLNDNIFHLQFHVNYTYYDFVAGMRINNGNTITQKGFIYDVIDRANTINSKLPVVVILDEINRTDISRVFGELFSAIEKRGHDIKLSLRDKNNKFLTLNIPNNIYFIGTLNEIDFSLERIDFALRRRFVWIEKTYDEDALRSILTEKSATNSLSIDIDSFCKKCSDVNKKIKTKLSAEYYIGHAFFAELAEIMKEMELNEKDALEELWNISIKPTLDAYCGNMETNEREDFVKDCYNVFFKGKKNTNSKNDDEPQIETNSTTSLSSVDE